VTAARESRRARDRLGAGWLVLAAALVGAVAVVFLVALLV
jgi:hypothetical protein